MIIINSTFIIVKAKFWSTEEKAEKQSKKGALGAPSQNSKVIRRLEGAGALQ